MEIQWQGIENRIQESREAIEQNNVNKAEAEAKTAVENWKIAVKDREYAYRDWETDRKSTRLNSSHITRSRMPSSA